MAGWKAGHFHWLWRMSVSCHRRATPTVVHPHRNQIGVASEAVGSHQSTRGPKKLRSYQAGRVKREPLAAHEQVIVFDAKRPIRREAKLQSRTNCFAPP